MKAQVQIDQEFEKLWRSGDGPTRITVLYPLKFGNDLIKPGYYELDRKTGKWTCIDIVVDGMRGDGG